MYVYNIFSFVHVYDNITLIVLIEHIKNLAEDTSLSEHIHKCKLITCVIINLIYML